MWDALPTAGCELPCLPQLMCLDNIYCEFLSSTYMHLFIQTHLTPELSEGLAKLQLTHTLLHVHARIQMDPRRIIEQQASASKGAPSTLTPQFKSTENIWKGSAKIYFLCNPELPTRHCLSDVRRHTLSSRQPGTAHIERGDIHSFNYYKWVHTLS